MKEPKYDLESTLDSTGHSEQLIRKLVSEGEHSEDIHEIITRNVDHIKIVLEKPYVINSESPRLPEFQEAVELGETFVAAE